MNARQGDLVLTEVELTRLRDLQDPYRAMQDADGRVVLLRGEQTGHAHVSRGAELVRDLPNPDLALLVTGPNGAVVEHEDHDPIALPANSVFTVEQKTPDRSERIEIVPDVRPRSEPQTVRRPYYSD